WGMSSRSWAFSSSCRSFMRAPGRLVLTGRLASEDGTRPPAEISKKVGAHGRGRSESVSAIRSGDEPLPQVGPPLLRPAAALLLAPGLDTSMVARQKDFGDFQA